MGILEEIFTASLWGEKPSWPDNWVQWVHISEREVDHCKTCIKLDGRWFLDDKKPKLPQHPHCHCTVKPIPLSKVMEEATSGCKLSKFNPYLFDPEEYYGHKKRAMFESWGYSISDSEWLQQECIKQGLEKYIIGEYTLGKLDEDGQRIRIRIELPRKSGKGTVSFITGWMVWPDGHIQLATPYGGK